MHGKTGRFLGLDPGLHLNLRVGPCGDLSRSQRRGITPRLHQLGEIHRPWSLEAPTRFNRGNTRGSQNTYPTETPFLIRGQQFVGDPAAFAKHANVCQEGGLRQDWLAKRRVRPVYSSWLLASTYFLVGVGGYLGRWLLVFACEDRTIMITSSPIRLHIPSTSRQCGLNQCEGWSSLAFPLHRNPFI